MYLEYWRLSQMPFENTPDPRFLYLSAQHEEALTRVLYAVQNRKGACMLTGIFGCGKTLIGQFVLRELSKDNYKTAFITNPRLDDVDLLRMIAHLLGAVEPPQSKTDVLIALENIINNNMRDGKETVIIIDEAHCIEKEGIFEELRLLLNFQTPERFLLTLVLFGQPELAHKIETNKQLNQRISIKSHLEALSSKDTSEYINHRLEVAGASDREIFNGEAVDSVYNSSGGIPRRINQICDMGLFTASCMQKKIVDAKIINEVTKTLVG